MISGVFPITKKYLDSPILSCLLGLGNGIMILTSTISGVCSFSCLKIWTSRIKQGTPVNFENVVF